MEAEQDREELALCIPHLSISKCQKLFCEFPCFDLSATKREIIFFTVAALLKWESKNVAHLESEGSIPL
jgi:hypothetical protein